MQFIHLLLVSSKLFLPYLGSPYFNQYQKHNSLHILFFCQGMYCLNFPFFAAFLSAPLLGWTTSGHRTPAKPCYTMHKRKQFYQSHTLKLSTQISMKRNHPCAKALPLHIESRFQILYLVFYLVKLVKAKCH